jgi:hypothetical protein
MHAIIEAVWRLLQRMLHPVYSGFNVGLATIVAPPEIDRNRNHTYTDPHGILNQGNADSS